MKKRSFKAYHANISFIDLLFNTVLGFAVFFIIAFVLMSIQKNQNDANIKTRAEIVVTLTWDNDSPDDVDLWIRDPEGHIMYFARKEVGLMHLDRDDLGQGQGNSIITSDGRTINVPYRQEIGAIRGNLPGEWVVNIHMYNKRSSNPTNVTVRIEKLNPQVQLVLLSPFVMTRHGEEITAARITMTADGTIVAVTTNPPVSLVSTELEFRSRESGGF